MSNLKDSTSVVISKSPVLSVSSVEAQRASPASFSVGSSSSMDFILSPYSSPTQSPIGSELSSSTLFPFSVENMMFGGANIGNLSTTKTDDDAITLVLAAYEQGVRSFHVSALYGGGLAEVRLGKALKILKEQHGARLSRDDIKLYITVGESSYSSDQEDAQAYDAPVPDVFKNPLHDKIRYQYDAAGIIGSFRDSLARLQVSQSDLAAVLVHDLDLYTHIEDAYEIHLAQFVHHGGYDALYSLKKKYGFDIGFGTRDTDLFASLLEGGHEYDHLMLQGGYTLLENNAFDSVLPVCMEHNVRVTIAGPFSSGLLAKPEVGSWLHHRDVQEGSTSLLKAQEMHRVCNENGVCLKQAALQYPLTHPCIDTVAVGAESIEQLMENCDLIKGPYLGGDFYEEILMVQEIDYEQDSSSLFSFLSQFEPAMPPPAALLCEDLPFNDSSIDSSSDEATL